LAASLWDELEKHRAEYQALGIDIDRACPRTDLRYYPFGAAMFDLLGDLRTRQRWTASNTAFVERDQSRRLQGFDDRAELVDVKLENGQTTRVLRMDYRELVPMLRHRHNLQHPAVRAILDRPRDVHTSVDARLQIKVSEALRKQLAAAKKEKGAAVVMEPGSGDVLAFVSLPLPTLGQSAEDDSDSAPIDRARYGLYPPGSTFKVVTAMAALRTKPDIAKKTYQCIHLPDGRVGNYVNSSGRPIRDDVLDTAPHGAVDLQKGLVVSCNAYFAQLGTYDVGPQALLDTANLLGIAAAAPNTAQQLRSSLPQASYGQGQVVASPFQMARVAAAVANGGMAPMGRWITDETNPRTNAPQQILPAAENQMLSRFLRQVVTSGTGRRAEAAVAVAGKTGTAELKDADSHAWFIGFAPYGAAEHKIAFSVLVENGIYGGQVAAPAASAIVNAAVQLGVIGR
jgi:peptidoglycan glycosyltransferase